MGFSRAGGWAVMFAYKGVTQSPLILVIDDMPEALQALLQQIRGQGWRLSLASEARQGLQRALALRPDLIVLDVRMPHMDGFTLCRLLREAPATRNTPIIFLTSAGSLGRAPGRAGDGGRRLRAQTVRNR